MDRRKMKCYFEHMCQNGEQGGLRSEFFLRPCRKHVKTNRKRFKYDHGVAFFADALLRRFFCEFGLFDGYYKSITHTKCMKGDNPPVYKCFVIYQTFSLWRELWMAICTPSCWPCHAICHNVIYFGSSKPIQIWVRIL